MKHHARHLVGVVTVLVVLPVALVAIANPTLGGGSGRPFANPPIILPDLPIAGSGTSENFGQQVIWDAAQNTQFTASSIYGLGGIVMPSDPFFANAGTEHRFMTVVHIGEETVPGVLLTLPLYPANSFAWPLQWEDPYDGLVVPAGGTVRITKGSIDDPVHYWITEVTVAGIAVPLRSGPRPDLDLEDVLYVGEPLDP